MDTSYLLLIVQAGIIMSQFSRYGKPYKKVPANTASQDEARIRKNSRGRCCYHVRTMAFTEHLELRWVRWIHPKKYYMILKFSEDDQGLRVDVTLVQNPKRNINNMAQLSPL